MMRTPEPGRMVRRCAGLAALVVAGCAPAARESPTQGRMVVAAAEAHAPLLQRQAALFQSLYPQAGVQVWTAPTREAFAALLADSVNLIVVDRPADAAEETAMQQLDIERIVLGEDALALLVNRANDLESLSLPLAGELLAGRLVDWSEIPGSGLLGPVTVVMTDRASGTWDLLETVFFPGQGVPRPAQIVATQAEVLRCVAASPGALGIVSIVAWRAPAAATSAAAATPSAEGWANGVAAEAADPAVRCLSIAGVDAEGNATVHALHQANVHRGLYPLHYPVYVYFDSRRSLATGFCAFLASAPGQKQVLEAGLVPATMPVRLVQLH